MKKRNFFNILLCLFMFFSVFRIPVNADSYDTITSDIDISPLTYPLPAPADKIYQQNGFYWSCNTSGTYVAMYIMPDGKLFYLSDTRVYAIYGNNGNVLNDVVGQVSNSVEYEGETYWYGVFIRSDFGFAAGQVTLSDYPSNLQNLALAVLSGTLINPTDWGNPADVNISTIYSGNVENSPSNIDKFTWNNNVDSNGLYYISHLDEHPVIEVQAVPVTWKTSTREEMENNAGGDPNIGTGVPLDSCNARTGHLEITWQEVINYLQIEYADIYSYVFDGTYWIMRGWFYQIRLVADGYTGEWITLSNGLNLTPKKSKKLIEDPYDETIYNLLKEISETNNQTTTVYEYGDNYITISNDPSTGWQDPDGGGSFWDFLASVVKAISDGIASIVSSVTSLVGDLVNGILGLFTFDTFEINNYNTEVQTLKDNSGIFGQSIEFADSIKDSIRGVEQQPAILHFDGIVIDDVQLIPAVDLDFDQMVIDAGLTDFHNLVYVFTDGAILISLIIMVHHKIMEVLRK